MSKLSNHCHVYQPFLMDEDLLSTILASCVSVSENANNFYLITYTFFEIGTEKEQRKEKEKNIGRAWSPTTVHQAVGLQESILDHSATTYVDIRAIYLYIFYLRSSD